MFTSFRRIIRSGFIGFFRNSFISLASVLVMTITLSIVCGLLIFGQVLEETLQVIESKVDINVYFVPEASEAQVLGVQSNLSEVEGVSNVEYISKEKALERYKERNASDEINLQVLEELGENPLGAVLNVSATNPTFYESINEYIDENIIKPAGDQTIIREVNFAKNQIIINRLTNLIDTTKLVSLIVAILVGIIAVIVTFNTFRLIIYMARDEVSVMKLVGASDDYIRGPFVITGMLTGLFASVVTIIAFYPITYFLAPSIEGYVGSINIFSYFTTNFGQFFILLAVSGMFLGAISSSLAVKRYLRV